MRAAAVLLLLIIAVAAGVWYAWPLGPLQWGFVGAGVLLEAVIVWAYFASPPSVKSERP
jgi:membrane protein YdbS with pleckstrin-like domain